MGDAIDQVTIVTEQEQPGAVAVEAADRHHPLRHANELEYRSPTALVARRRYVTDRLVQDNVAPSLRPQRPAIDPDILPLGIDAHAHVTDDRPVDRDATRSDQLFRFAARRYAVLGEDALQSPLHRALLLPRPTRPSRRRRKPIRRVQGQLEDFLTSHQQYYCTALLPRSLGLSRAFF